jgi:phospholipid/cholesterol/gamma-HCH transport system substrate-binding protein
VIDNGSVTATQLRRFLQDNRVHLASLINSLVTTGDIVVKHLAGLRQVLIIYPYVVEGGFTVVSRSPETGLYDAHFGMVMTNDPVVCHNGYQSTDGRPPQDGSNRPMNVRAHCAEPAAQSNPRGAQHAPANRPAAAYGARANPSSARTPVASYDPSTGRLTWGDHVSPRLADTGSLAPATLGEESWKWLLLQPLASTPR